MSESHFVERNMKMTSDAVCSEVPPAAIMKESSLNLLSKKISEIIFGDRRVKAGYFIEEKGGKDEDEYEGTTGKLQCVICSDGNLCICGSDEGGKLWNVS